MPTISIYEKHAYERVQRIVKLEEVTKYPGHQLSIVVPGVTSDDQSVDNIDDVPYNISYSFTITNDVDEVFRHLYTGLYDVLTKQDWRDSFNEYMMLILVESDGVERQVLYLGYCSQALTLFESLK